MRITRINVSKLFGVFDHEIPLDIGEHVRIIHGPNGYGKTMILTMLDALFSSKYSVLRSIPFKELKLQFDDGSSLSLTKEFHQIGKHSDERETSGSLQLRYIKKDKHSEQEHEHTIPSLARFRVDFPIGLIEEVIPELERVGPQQWLLQPSNELLSVGDVIERFNDRLPIELPSNQKMKEEPDWLKRIKEAIHITFIQTQRLLSYYVPARIRHSYDERSRNVPAVIEYSKELAQSIQKKLAEYGSLSQSRDRTFPFRLLESRPQSDLTIQELRKKLGDLETKREQLISTGLLNKEEQLNFGSLQKIDENNKNVLLVYINDVEEKLRVFDNLTDKIYLFLKLINNKFLHKQMFINSNEGFTFRTSEGQPLSPAKLSSGEQHELILLFELLFKVVPNSLILIDEPELSLHIYWQQRFLQDLDEITKLSQFDVLIATHSPQIIQNRWDLTIELKGPEDEKVPES